MNQYFLPKTGWEFFDVSRAYGLGILIDVLSGNVEISDMGGYYLIKTSGELVFHKIDDIFTYFGSDDDWKITLITIQRSTKADLKRSVIKLAGIASKAGLFGVVSSGYESEEIKKLYPELKTVVPGIRLSRNSDDQARVLTPAEALKKRADYIVVGRDITHSPDPESKIKLYLEEIEKCR